MKLTAGKDLIVNDIVIVDDVRFKVLPKMLGGCLIDIDFNGTGSPTKLVIDPDKEYQHVSSVEFTMEKCIISGPRVKPFMLTVPEGRTITHRSM